MTRNKSNTKISERTRLSSYDVRATAFSALKNTISAGEPGPFKSLLIRSNQSTCSLPELIADVHQSIMRHGTLGNIIMSSFPSGKLFCDERMKLPKLRWIFLYIGFAVEWLFIINKSQMMRASIHYQGYYIDSQAADSKEVLGLIGTIIHDPLSTSFANVFAPGTLTASEVAVIISYLRPISTIVKILDNNYICKDDFHMTSSFSQRWYRKYQCQLPSTVSFLSAEDLNSVLQSVMSQSMPADMSFSKASMCYVQDERLEDEAK